MIKKFVKLIVKALKIKRIFSVSKKIYHLTPLPISLKIKIAESIFNSDQSLREFSLSFNSVYTLDNKEKLENQGNEITNQDNKNKIYEEILVPEPYKRVLIVEHRIPTPDKTSGSLRLLSVLKILAKQGWDITFVSDNYPENYHWVLDNIKDELLEYEKNLLKYVKKIIYGDNDLLHHLVEEGKTYKLAILSYPEIMHKYSPYVRFHMTNCELVYDTVDIHFIRYLRQYSCEKSNEILQKSKSYKQMEIANFEIADSILAITENEKKEIIKYVPKKKVGIIPNIHICSQRNPSPKNRSGILFIGHYLHAPNEDAVIYLVKNLLPKIKDLVGDIKVTLLGSSVTKKVQELSSEYVEVIGFVKDPEEWFNKSRVFLAPLRYGAGMKGKIGQTLSLGLPAVTTSIGSEGMNLENGKNILIADNDDDIAIAVSKLYTDDYLWEKVSREGIAHVNKHFSEEAVGSNLKRFTINNEFIK